MKLIEIGVKNYRSKEILTEGWQQLTESQQIYIGRWETTVWPLVEGYSRLLEQELDPRAIQKIFTSAEQVLNAQGKNTTALGKAGNVTSQLSSKIKQQIEKLAKASQQTQPIQNIDKQFEQLKLKIKNELSGSPIGRKLLTTVDGWKQFAEENPGKSAFVLGAMTSVLAFASGGIVSGAAIGLFIRLANNVIKGDSLSTALGKSAKGAALGAAAGLIGDIFQANNVEIPQDGELNISTDSSSMSDQVTQTFSSNDEYLQAWAEETYNQGSPSDLTDPYKDQIIQRIIDNAEVNGDVSQGRVEVNLKGGSMPMGFYLTDEEITEYSNISDMQERLDYIRSIYGEPEQDAEFDNDSDNEPKKLNLNKESIEALWDRLDAYELTEAPAMLGTIGKFANRAADEIGKVAQKGVGKAAQGAKAVGKELGSTVTVRKLSRMWKKSGSPTDLESIVNILKSAGLSDEQIGTVSKQAQINLTSTSAQPGQVDVQSLAKQITDLGLADEVKRVLNPKGPEDRTAPAPAKVDYATAQKNLRLRGARAMKNKFKPIR